MDSENSLANRSIIRENLIDVRIKLIYDNYDNFEGFGNNIQDFYETDEIFYSDLPYFCFVYDVGCQKYILEP